MCIFYIIHAHVCEGKAAIVLYLSLLFSDFSTEYGACKKAVDLLATLDCLVSLAKVAVMPGYVWYVNQGFIQDCLLRGMKSV